MSAPKLLQLLVPVLVGLTVLFLVEAAGYLILRNVGDILALTHPIVVMAVVWFAARRIPDWPLQFQALAGFVVGMASSYLNYLFLYFLMVKWLHVLDDGLFFYFGTVYGLLPPIAGVLGGVAAALAGLQRAKRKAG